MTHEELLAGLKARINEWRPVETRFCIPLLAVVELHKPNEFDDCPICVIRTVLGLQVQPYPCPTIQAIEEQLK